MGYIPPPGESGSGDNNAGSDSTSGSGSSGTGSDGTIITIPNPAKYIPQNPSIGLKLFGPLVPASDNVAGLFFLTGLQFGIGCVGFARARQLRKSKLFYSNIPNTFQRKLTKYACIAGGSYLIFQSGLELTRLSLPYDPWKEEARYYRKVARNNGDKPNWWFGATGYYVPMSFKEWNSKVELWLNNAANQIELEEALPGRGKGTHVSSTSTLIANLAKKGKYGDIYEQLRTTNQKRYQTLLAEDLNDVHELNKAERIDLILEEKGPVYINSQFTKPPIQLGNHALDTDDHLDIVWGQFDPWHELKIYTEYDIRLVPIWRWSEGESEDVSVVADVEDEA